MLSIRQMDRQGVSTSFSDGLCEMKDRTTGRIVLHCRIKETNGLYTLSQEQFEDQSGIGHQLCIAHSIRTDPASRLHYILNHALGHLPTTLRSSPYSRRGGTLHSKTTLACHDHRSPPVAGRSRTHGNERLLSNLPGI